MEKNFKEKATFQHPDNEMSGCPNKGLRAQLRQSRNWRGSAGPVHFTWSLSSIRAPKSAPSKQCRAGGEQNDLEKTNGECGTKQRGGERAFHQKFLQVTHLHMLVSEMIPFLSLKAGDNCPVHCQWEALTDQIFPHFPYNFPYPSFFLSCYPKFLVEVPCGFSLPSQKKFAEFIPPEVVFQLPPHPSLLLHLWQAHLELCSFCWAAACPVTRVICGWFIVPFPFKITHGAAWDGVRLTSQKQSGTCPNLWITATLRASRGSWKRKAGVWIIPQPSLILSII